MHDAQLNHPIVSRSALLFPKACRSSLEGTGSTHDNLLRAGVLHVRLRLARPDQGTDQIEYKTNQLPSLDLSS
jgi:hypothetical protein